MRRYVVRNVLRKLKISSWTIVDNEEPVIAPVDGAAVNIIENIVTGKIIKWAVNSFKTYIAP